MKPFADDLSIISYAKKLPETIFAIKYDLNIISPWLNANKLMFNISNHH